MRTTLFSFFNRYSEQFSQLNKVDTWIHKNPESTKLRFGHCPKKRRNLSLFEWNGLVTNVGLCVSGPEILNNKIWILSSTDLIKFSWHHRYYKARYDFMESGISAIPITTGNVVIGIKRFQQEYFYCPQTKVWGKVIFLHLCVILFTRGSASGGSASRGGGSASRGGGLHPGEGVCIRGGGSASRGSPLDTLGYGQQACYVMLWPALTWRGQEWAQHVQGQLLHTYVMQTAGSSHVMELLSVII